MGFDAFSDNASAVGGDKGIADNMSANSLAGGNDKMANIFS